MGSFRKVQGDRTGAITAYRAAVNALQTIKTDLTTASADVQFNFQDGVEPVYRELVQILLQRDGGQPNQVDLREARQLVVRHQ